MRDVVVINAVRTPIGRYMGALKEVPNYDLLAMASSVFAVVGP